ncbi:hypothetical protein Pfo_024382 [Paulownia fortunei]|nr:hypothetical protein Pfo_024382 [Paulownia fortunei]
MAKKKKNQKQPKDVDEPGGSGVFNGSVSKPLTFVGKNLVDTNSATKLCDSSSVSCTLADVDSDTELLQSSFGKEVITYLMFEENSKNDADKVFEKSPMKTATPKAT